MRRLLLLRARRRPWREPPTATASALRIALTESHRSPHDRVGRPSVFGHYARDKRRDPAPRRRMSLRNVAAARCSCPCTAIIVGSDTVGTCRRHRHCRVPERWCGWWHVLWCLRKAEGSRATIKETHPASGPRTATTKESGLPADSPRAAARVASRSACVRASARGVPPPSPARGCAGGSREWRTRSDGRVERRSKEEEEKSTQRANAPARLRR